MNGKKHLEGCVCNRGATVIGWLIGIFAIGAFVPAVAHAQSTSGRIFGWAPAGEVVVAHGDTGAHRQVTVKDSGRYSIGRVPLGTYQVVLMKDGKPTDTRSHVAVMVGRGMEVDFACPHDHCAR